MHRIGTDDVGGITMHRNVVEAPRDPILAVGRDGTPSEGMVYLQFEGNADGRYGGQQVARFNLAWVLEGEETGEE